jgi:predicted DNA binding CopG/RHH family protein
VKYFSWSSERLDSYESGEWLPVKNSVAETRRYLNYAQIASRQDSLINIRISSKGLDALQKKALEEGIPYQTLISSVLHQNISGRLKEQT